MKPKQVIIEDSTRAIVLLKLTTDRREALRGFSAIAELHVLVIQLIIVAAGRT